MKRLLLYLLLAFGIVAAVAMFAQAPAKSVAASQPAASQTAKPSTASASVPSAPVAAPAISADHRAEFFKRQLALNQAQQTMQQAQSAFQSAIAQLAKDCGEKFLPQISQQAGEQQGDPVCVQKAEPPKPATPKK